MQLAASVNAPDPADRRIVARGLTRRFGAKTALHPTDLELGPGGISGLLGPNGSGKSTLLRVLTGLTRPDAGTASIDGVALSGDGTAIRKRCAYAPGEIALYTEMRADEHLKWLLRGRDRGAYARARAIAESLGLPLRGRVRAFSHGMKRQLMFAAALAPDVRVRILDEPTEGLDPTKRGTVLDLLREDARRGTTVVLSSHHLGEVDRVCDRLVFMNEGRKIADDTAEAIARRARRFVRFAYASSANAREIELALARIGGARVRMETTPAGLVRANIALESDDARAFIAAACTASGLSAPLSIEFGQLSLSELYRELYGVEGC
jgi:ABC-2 type transport system ATP-binding protein